jgi:hypothetical protein
MEVSGQLHDPFTLPPGKEPPWVKLRTGLDPVAKRRNPVIIRAGNRKPVFLPVA